MKISLADKNSRFGCLQTEKESEKEREMVENKSGKEILEIGASKERHHPNGRKSSFRNLPNKAALKQLPCLAMVLLTIHPSSEILDTAHKIWSSASQIYFQIGNDAPNISDQPNPK